MKIYQKPGKNVRYAHVHENEEASLAAGLRMVGKYGGKLITLAHSTDGKTNRNVTFSYKKTVYKFDPNRIYTQDLNVLKNSDWYCEKLVVVIISGRPIIITDQLPTINALLAAWLPGTEGIGVADILFGDAPLQGTLPYSWPASAEQLPFDFAEIAKKGCSPALFPVGYGLGVKEAKPLPICSTP